ncbi:hypothetical protein [uncultured Microbulbifer sp.]|uniref:hypothetical protein n=1 Tax=uncultured Microbulbifer sp. TaxID=348147 RepID=UPI002620BF17|nr:hypothetical protein [uncultured Microbulbifer sp.]
MKRILLIIGILISLVASADNDDICIPSEFESCDSVETVRIHILDTVPYTGEMSISDCSDLSNSLASVTTTIFDHGVPYAASAREFTSILSSSEGVLKTIDGKDLQIVPDSIKLQRLGYMDFEINDWESNPTLEGRDITQLAEIESCFLTDEISYFSYDLLLSTDDNLTNWLSQDARENQIGYDSESQEVFKFLYGKDGLGYGDYVIGGVYYKNTPRFLTAEWSYDEFSIIWELMPVELSERVNELIPGDILNRLKDNWLGNCQPIKVRIAQDPDFITSTNFITNKPSHCVQNPFFTNLQNDIIPDNTTAEFTQYLEKRKRFHHIAFLMNDIGEVIPCEERDKISLDGCSQKIVQEFEILLRSFLRKEHDLFIELNLPKWKNKVYRIDRFNGEVASIHP